MNRTLSRTILGLVLLVASSLMTGAAAPQPGTSPLSVASTQEVDVPDDCIFERNLGACITCCMEAVDAPANVCAHFCLTVRFPPPPPPAETEP
jgi:hypothetical protein